MSYSGPPDITEIKRRLEQIDRERQALISERIAHLAEAHGSLRKLAKAIRIDHVWLWRIAKGTKQASPRVLVMIGLLK